MNNMQEEYVAQTLIDWYADHKRELPWRIAPSPYHTWLSEIILQQTRVDQGVSYYERFIEAFPTVEHLANADESKILKLWQGLGYYSRARNLHKAANQIVGLYKGKLPSSYNDLLRLSGVGPYTAAAIASIAYNLPHAVLDGNVFRVLSRVYGIDTPIDSTAGKKQFQEVAASHIGYGEPQVYNQAIMEFGALQCTPKKPSCDTCPLSNHCAANKLNTQLNLPVKEGKIKIKKRYFNYLIITDGNNVLLEKRHANDIWKHLYQFPLIETYNAITSPDELDLNQSRAVTSPHTITGFVTVQRKHILSHQHIYATFTSIKMRNLKTEEIPNLISVAQSEIDTFALPRLIDRFLEQHPSGKIF